MLGWGCCELAGQDANKWMTENKRRLTSYQQSCPQLMGEFLKNSCCSSETMTRQQHRIFDVGFHHNEKNTGNNFTIDQKWSLIINLTLCAWLWVINCSNGFSSNLHQQNMGVKKGHYYLCGTVLNRSILKRKTDQKLWVWFHMLVCSWRILGQDAEPDFVSCRELWHHQSMNVLVCE